MIDLRLPTCAVARRRSLCSFAFSDASGDGARFCRAHAESLEILAALDKYGYHCSLSANVMRFGPSGYWSQQDLWIGRDEAMMRHAIRAQFNATRSLEPEW